MTLTLSMRSCVISCAHCLTEKRIKVKLNENRLKGSGDMKRTQISRVNALTLTFCLGSWVMCSAHRPTKRNICI